jgi:prophage regulatory protein
MQALFIQQDAVGDASMDSKYVPRDNVVMAFDDSKIAFGFSGRAWDEVNHKLVVVQLPDRPIIYGEWSARYLPNGNDFNAEVSTFGYRDGYLAGSTNPSDRLTFSGAEKEKIENLIRRLPEVIRRTGLSRSEIYRRLKDGRFPKSQKLSPRVAVWSSTDIRHFCEQAFASGKY